MFTARARDVVDLGVLSQTPVVGSGSFETTVSVDEFVFTVPEGGSRVVVELGGVYYGGDQYSSWVVSDGDGLQLASGSRRWGAARFDHVLDAGQYRLRYSPEYNKIGTYATRIYLPPVPQEFAVSSSTTTPVVISNGVPGAGAGNLETWLSRDMYAFTASAGDAVFIDVTSTYGAERYARWELADASGVVVAEGALSTDVQVPGLASGDYTWSVFLPTASTQNGGTYAVKLTRVPAS